MTTDPVVPLAAVGAVAALALGACVTLALRRRARRWAWWRRAGIVLLLGVIAVRPGGERSDADVLVSDLDVFFVVDRTGSMVAEDHQGGTRLDGVRSDVLALADALPGARWSLVGFDDEVTTLVPLISDPTALRDVVERLRPEVQDQASGSSPRLAAGAVADRVLAAEDQEPDRRQVVFLFTDGETTVEQPSTDRYTAVGERIVGGAVLGYGTTEGAPMRVWDASGPTEHDVIDARTDAPAISVIDRSTLRELAIELDVPLLDRTAGDALDEAVRVIDQGGERTTPGRVPVHQDLGWWWAYPLLGLVWWEVAAVTIDVARFVPRRPDRGAVPG